MYTVCEPPFEEERVDLDIHAEWVGGYDYIDNIYNGAVYDVEIVNGVGSVNGYLRNMPADTHIVEVSMQVQNAHQIRLSVGGGSSPIVMVSTTLLRGWRCSLYVI